MYCDVLSGIVMLRTPDRRDAEVAQWVQTLTDRYAGVKLVVGRDKLDEVQVSLFFRPPLGDLPVHSGCTP
jgi:hypothetical protein